MEQRRAREIADGVRGAASGTAGRILDVAERLVQMRGFNGFSYADIAGELGMTKASLHYHFPAKADLGRSLVERYHAAFLGSLGLIDRDVPEVAGKLRRFAGIYVEVVRQGRLCLCGMLAADFDTLPDAMKAGVRRFFDATETWLGDVLDRGRNEKALRFQGTPRDAASLVLSSLEGAMLIARAYGDAERFERIALRLLSDLGARPPADLG